MEFCDSNGKGIDQSGNEISIEEEQYFQNILETGESLLYVGVDEHIKQESVVVVERLANGRFMLLFYPVEKLNGLLADDEALSSSAFLALIDAEAWYFLHPVRTAGCLMAAISWKRCRRMSRGWQRRSAHVCRPVPRVPSAYRYQERKGC